MRVSCPSFLPAICVFVSIRSFYNLCTKVVVSDLAWRCCRFWFYGQPPEIPLPEKEDQHANIFFFEEKK